MVTPRILQEVETFITKFPMAEVLTCPEDKLSKCPPEILEEIFQYLDSEDLKSVVLVNKTLCDVGKKPKFWYKSMVRLQSLDDGVGFYCAIYCAVVSAENLLTRKSSRRLLRK